MMQRREQYLLGGFVTAIVLWQASGWVSSAVFGPFQTRSDDYTRLKKSVSDKEDQLLALVRSKRLLKEWQSSSLPPDPGKPKQPTALNAQRLYLQWVTDLAQLCGMEDLRVTPGGLTQKGNVYISVVVRLEAEARYDQLARFLDLFYRTNLLHRVSSLQISNKVFEGDPVLKVSLSAEGLALLDAPARRTLFPQTTLRAALTEEATKLTVAEGTDFPKEVGFRIQIKNEFLKVTAIDGNEWTVERGVERTLPSACSEGMVVELVRLNTNQTDRSLDELRAMSATSIFVKPSPPYKMKLGPLSEKTFTRGKPVDFTISVLGFDALKGKPEFAIVGAAPAGLKLDKSGKVSWKPGSETEPGKYAVKFEVRHASAPQGSLSDTFTIRLKDPNPTPKLGAAKPPKVYLNRPWKFRPEIVIPEGLTTRISWKLGDKSPPGLTINDRTGELSWVPGDAVSLGELTIPVVVTDSDTPPQATNLPVKVEVQDDAAQFTRLFGTMVSDDRKRLFLVDQSTDKKTELHEGDQFAISDLNGTIKRIAGKFVVMTLGQQDIRWDVGQSLREAQEKIKEN